MKARILVLLLCLTPLSQAAIYRWVDESGKVHFSDKQPENNATAQDISGQLRPLNNDSSTTETEKLKTVFPGETASTQAKGLPESTQPAPCTAWQGCFRR